MHVAVDEARQDCPAFQVMCGDLSRCVSCLEVLRCANILNDAVGDEHALGKGGLCLEAGFGVVQEDAPVDEEFPSACYLILNLRHGCDDSILAFAPSFVCSRCFATEEIRLRLCVSLQCVVIDSGGVREGYGRLCW